jgi:hypothetical protein
MKRLLTMIALLAVLSIPALAGDIDMPGAPAPCTQSCPSAAPGLWDFLTSLFGL